MHNVVELRVELTAKLNKEISFASQKCKFKDLVTSDEKKKKKESGFI